MKVVHVTFNFPPEMGGIGRYVQNLSDYLVKKNIEVAVVTLATRLHYSCSEPKAIQVFRVKAFRLPLSDPIPINLFSVLRVLTKTRNPKILHLHGHLTFFCLFSAFFCRVLRIPYVVTHHGEGLESGSLSKINGIIRHNMIAKYVLRNAKLIISVTENEVEIMIKKYGLSADKITVIHNGVNSKQFGLSSASHAIPEEWSNKRVILSGGILGRVKGFEYLIRAVSLVVKEYRDARLIITGDGPDRARLQSISDSLGMGEFVKFLGRIEPDLLPSIYDSSFMYVLPSLYDACPTTVLEAMASRKPVVVTSNGGQRELVINGVNGFVVPPANIKALAEAILTLLSHEVLATEMGSQGRKMVEENYDWDRIGQKILQTYSNLQKDECLK